MLARKAMTHHPVMYKLIEVPRDSALPPSPGKGPRVRRSMSSDLQAGAAASRNDPAVKELVAGQRRAAEDKKGSRHADVIDRWDPTGLGSAMWHQCVGFLPSGFAAS